MTARYNRETSFLFKANDQSNPFSTTVRSLMVENILMNLETDNEKREEKMIGKLERRLKKQLTETIEDCDLNKITDLKNHEIINSSKISVGLQTLIQKRFVADY